MTPLSRRRVVVLFAHPDDEIGVYPWLQAARERGVRVVCAFLTDGGWGGQRTAVRRRESQDVLAAFGLAGDDVLFLGEEWGVADGTLYRVLDDTVERLDARLRELCRDGEVWIPAWEGGHPDHDASHLAGLELARRAGATAYQFSLYHGRGLSGPWFRVLSPLPENGPLHALPVSLMERLRCVLHCLHYRSQWKSFVGLLPFYALRMLRRHPFVLQPADGARTAQRPHPGAMLYERRGGPSWEAFASGTTGLRTAARH